MNERASDELGAHVSTEGGLHLAPQRAGEIGASCLQLFTKQPSRWAEPLVDHATAEAFREAGVEHGITVAGAHDSYLINLSSPDRALWGRSLACLEGELRRCAALGLEPTRILLELTAGSGSSVGGSFENLAAILDLLPEWTRERVGVCLDTCHAYAAGYDLVLDYDGVWRAFDRVLGRERLGLLHLNDSKHALGSRRDRHETLGQGTMGTEPFRRIMLDDTLREVPKILETPKGDDSVAADRANLSILRSFRGA
jgi:deoxyribonuclease-4